MTAPGRGPPRARPTASSVAPRPRRPSIVAGAAALAGADFDADGDKDLAVATPTGIERRSGSRIGTQGTTTFQSDAQLGNESSRAVAMGDVDGDGDLDLVVTVDGGANRVYANR